jgi:hypothetical protein
MDRDGRNAPAVAQQESREPVTGPLQSLLTIPPPRIVAELSVASTRLCGRDVPPDVPPPRRA